MTILTKKEAADLLTISTKKLTQMVENSEVPHTMIGKRVRFIREDLIDWLKAGGSGEKDVFSA